mmetsp:Transcript_63699/g.150784  ORF Transcript_63699/g.150784 Transcript_63699/m.150784 type:complete len:207 (+) Transcript_63699:353-973(+)
MRQSAPLLTKSRGWRRLWRSRGWRRRTPSKTRCTCSTRSAFSSSGSTLSRTPGRSTRQSRRCGARRRSSAQPSSPSSRSVPRSAAACPSRPRPSRKWSGNSMRGARRRRRANCASASSTSSSSASGRRRRSRGSSGGWRQRASAAVWRMPGAARSVWSGSRAGFRSSIRGRTISGASLGRRWGVSSSSFWRSGPRASRSYPPRRRG